MVENRGGNQRRFPFVTGSLPDAEKNTTTFGIGREIVHERYGLAAVVYKPLQARFKTTQGKRTIYEVFASGTIQDRGGIDHVVLSGETFHLHKSRKR